jgi:hypothetical protein
VNEDQFDAVAQRVIKRPTQRWAVKLYMLDGLTAYAAEMKIHGAVTNTVARDARRVKELFDFCERVTYLNPNLP